MPRFSVNSASFKDMTEFEAYTPPPEPVDATLKMNIVPVSKKTADALEYMAPEEMEGVGTVARKES